MTNDTLPLTTILSDFEGQLSHLEVCPNDPEAISAARQCLKKLLKFTLGVPTTEEVSLTELIQQSIAANKRDAALFCYRALSAEAIFADENNSHLIHIRLVQLIEGVTPDLLPEKKDSFEKRQTYEKLRSLRTFMLTLFVRLEPLTKIPHTVDDIVSQKQHVLSAINGKQVKSFFSPYGFSEAAAKISSLLNECETVRNCDDHELGQLVEELIIKLVADIAEQKRIFSIIGMRFIQPFYDTVKHALENLRISSRARFCCSIKPILLQGRLEKKYPLAEPGRHFALSLPMENTGPGTAFDVRVELSEPDHLCLHSRDMLYVGNLRPGRFSLSIDCLTVTPAKDAVLSVYASWRSACDPSPQEALFDIGIAAQQSDTDWATCATLRPYNTEVAEGKDFFGRREKVLQIANRFLRHPMISCYITGQKRVGKTSIALAARDYIISHSDGTDYKFKYYLWGDFSFENARDSIRYLGEDLAEFFKMFIPSGRSIPHVDFSGSLAPLNKLLDIVTEYHKNTKFIVIIDEFDEIHSELYTFGNLAETFFSNIRALSAGKSLAFMFVGGENMQFIMSQQGQKLNKFERENINYFSREKEWDDYCNLISQPSAKTLVWHQSALSEIFSITNGNPFFTKVLCSWIFSAAVDQRDTDVTSDEVRRILNEKIGQLDMNAFVHFWQDGIPKIKSELKPVELQRCRTLVAIARTMRKGIVLTRRHIKDEKHSTDISESQIQAVLDDFCRRDVIREEGGHYLFTLPIFELWLSDVGMSKIISDELGEELHAVIQREEDKAYVTAEEIVELSERWPLYQGRKLAPDDIRAWLEQVESHRERRLLFKLLQRIRFFSDQEIRQLLGDVHRLVRQSIPTLQRVPLTRSQRIFELAVVYIDGQGKSGQRYASSYAEENKISTKCIFSSENFQNKVEDFEKREGRKVDGIVIIDDFVGSGKQICENLKRFMDANPCVWNRSVPIIAVAIAATKKGFESVQEYIDETFHGRIIFRACEVLEDRYIAFNDEGRFWESVDEGNKAKSLCVNIGAYIYQDHPLGFAEQGILVVFPTTVPNNSLPILHSASSREKKWRPLFPRLVN